MGVLEQEICLLLARVGAAQTETGALLVEFSPLSIGAMTVVRRPGCAVCWGTELRVDNVPITYELDASVTMPPARLRRPRGHQKHYEESSARLQHERRSPLAAAEIVPLPHEQWSNSAGSPISISALAALLEYSFGVNVQRSGIENALRRWAPTGGNLGSPQAYASIRGVRGLEDGRYYYDPFAHTLVPLGPLTTTEGPPVEVIIAAEMTRVWRKYGNFGYRIVHLDTGVAMRHLLLVAAARGLQISNVEAWDDRDLANRFGLDRNSQIVSAVIHFRAGATA